MWLLSSAAGAAVKESNSVDVGEGGGRNTYAWTHGDVRVRVVYGNGGSSGSGGSGRHSWARRRRPPAPPPAPPWVWFCYGSSDRLCVTKFPYSRKKKVLVVRKRVEEAERRTGRGGGGGGGERSGRGTAAKSVREHYLT